MTSLRPQQEPEISSVELACQLARIASDNRLEDVVVLDLRELSSITDFFIIATGTSDRQMRSTADDMEEHCRKLGQPRFGVSGYEAGTWVLADFVDIVVHLFDADRRRYYDLELLWGDAARIDWQKAAS